VGSILLFTIELDGFYILEASGCEFPEDAHVVTLSDHKLASVGKKLVLYHFDMLFNSVFLYYQCILVAEDLVHFTDLILLDVSEVGT